MASNLTQALTNSILGYSRLFIQNPWLTYSIYTRDTYGCTMEHKTWYMYTEKNLLKLNSKTTWDTKGNEANVTLKKKTMRTKRN